MRLDDLRVRARDGALNADELHMIAGHMQRGNDGHVRSLAIEIAGLHVAATGDPALTIELIAIAESRDEADEPVRADAVRALARGTGYHGQRVVMDL
jgi:HEAT repeat protein